MIAMVIIAGCSFILCQDGRRWWWPVIAGAAMINIYFFKATGLSVAIAMMVYLVVVLVSKRRKPQQVFSDVCLMLAGSVIGLIPLLLFHMQQGAVNRLMRTLPVYMIAAGLCVVAVSFVIYRLLAIFSRTSDSMEEQAEPEKKPKLLVGISCAVMAVILVILGIKLGLFAKISGTIFSSGGYLDWSRGVRTYGEQAKYVFRYYGVLKLPVIFACIAIIIGAVSFIKRLVSKIKTDVNPLDTLVLFMSVWWILDMAFVWVSPRPYEQYYLPLNASAAMLAGYVIWRYCQTMNKPSSKGIFIGGSVIGILAMLIMAWPVYGGLSKSPYSGIENKDRQGNPVKKRGYVQRLKEVSDSKKYTAPWKAAGQYIKNNSAETDRMYVWGWFPGIYVQSQRLCAAKVASFSDMHVMPPEQLKKYVEWLLAHFGVNTPKYIVDSRKWHYPNNRPPLELWPTINPLKRGNREFIQNNTLLADYNEKYLQMLSGRYGQDEADRYKAMEGFRNYIRENYTIVNINFGEIVVYKLKSDTNTTSK